MDIYLAIDIVVSVTLAVSVFLFFRSKNNFGTALFLFVFVLFYVTVNIGYAKTGGEKLEITKRIFDWLGIFVVVSIVVVYQQSIKTFFAKMNRPRLMHEQSEFGYVSNDEELSAAARAIVKAAQNMAKNDIGAIIIIAPTIPPKNILDSGTRLNALISTPLIESIFNKKSPLHDGAVIVQGMHILAAGCFLPLSQVNSISKDLGTRHRAAIGITEETDVLSIVISEETGVISTVKNGELKRYVTPEKLLDTIESVYGISYSPTNKSRRIRQ